ncbi:MAG: hypothetical protein IJS90_08790 [Clostridia bacterium]|nr:hypothetical protein [Clostridia bacterium]
MKKAKAFLFRRKYFFIILTFLILYSYIVVGKCKPWFAFKTSYEFHSLDFSLGFGSFIWPGQLYQWICGAPDSKTLTAYHIVLVLLFFIALAAFLDRLMNIVEKKDRPVALVLTFLFLTGPFTFSVLIGEMGFLEVYWIYMGALFFLLLAYKSLNILAAPLCVLALMLNYAAIICYVPFFCIMLLYKYVTETSKSAKRMLMASFIICVAVSIPSFIYLVLYTQKNMFYSFEEFNSILKGRGVKEFSYVDILFYGREKEAFDDNFYETLVNSDMYTQGENLTVVQELFNFIELRFTYVLYSLWMRNPLRVIPPFIAILPVVVLIFRFCLSELKNKKNTPLRRFVFFCMPALFSVTIFVSLPVSHDTFKWIDFAFVPLFSSFMYVMYREPEKVFAFVRKAVSPFSAPQIAMYCVMYSFSVFSVYF